MDAVLSVQGASAPVKKKSFFSKFTRKKSFFSKFTRLNMLRLGSRCDPGCCSDDVLPATGDGR